MRVDKSRMVRVSKNSKSKNKPKAYTAPWLFLSLPFGPHFSFHQSEFLVRLGKKLSRVYYFKAAVILRNLLVVMVRFSPSSYFNFMSRRFKQIQILSLKLKQKCLSQKISSFQSLKWVKTTSTFSHQDSRLSLK